ncbi:hypothetical protein [Pyrodictium abyssi]|uniref:hypothetical protein n=1 Tax=Pyrodictium abyssi TaxID=54256 RepID=UPI0030C75FE4
MLIDTSLAWVMARGPSYLAEALRAFFRKLGSNGCSILYSEAVYIDLRHERREKREQILSQLRSLAQQAPVDMKLLLMRVGRYGATVRKLGLADVLIALAAREVGAVLATGDWGQARFYINIAGADRPPVIYIPVKLITEAEKR